MYIFTYAYIYLYIYIYIYITDACSNVSDHIRNITFLLPHVLVFGAQKRPTLVSKETYSSVKRDLL